MHLVAELRMLMTMHWDSMRLMPMMASHHATMPMRSARSRVASILIISLT